jgi:large subunit ribosomal protein L25
MPEKVTIQAQPRTITGKAVKRLRKQGIIPAHVYGHGRDSAAIQLDGHAFEHFLATHRGMTLLGLNLGDGQGEDTVVIAHVQHEPATHTIQHVDFLHVELSQAIRARVPIHLQGDAPALKISGALMLHLLDAVEVEARPADIPEALQLDVSDMEELKTAKRVSDLIVPPRVKVLTDAEEPVLKVEPSKLTLELEAAASAEAEAAPEAAAAETPAAEETPTE